jgi:polyhydroxyalkanoate synthesis regulator phasin
VKIKIISINGYEKSFNLKDIHRNKLIIKTELGDKVEFIGVDKHYVDIFKINKSLIVKLKSGQIIELQNIYDTLVQENIAGDIVDNLIFDDKMSQENNLSIQLIFMPVNKAIQTIKLSNIYSIDTLVQQDDSSFEKIVQDTPIQKEEIKDIVQDIQNKNQISDFKIEENIIQDIKGIIQLDDIPTKIEDKPIAKTEPPKQEPVITIEPPKQEPVITIEPPKIPTINGSITYELKPKITGTAILENGETLSVKIANETFENVQVIDGNWSIQTTQELNDNTTYNIQAQVINRLGDIAKDTTTNELTIDTVLPRVDNILTNNPKPTISGKIIDASANDSLTVKFNGATWENVTIRNDGKWSIDTSQIAPTTGTFNALVVNKKYDVAIVLTNNSNEIKTDITTGEVIFDNTPPPMPNSKLKSDTGISNSDNLTNNADITPLTNKENGATVKYSLDGTSWHDSYETIKPTASGDYTVKIKQTDEAGNQSAIKEISFKLDVSPPSKPDAKLKYDTTNSLVENENDFITNKADIKAPINTQINGVIEYSFDGANWSQTYTKPTDDGRYSLQIRETDKAGNKAIQIINFTLDKTAPELLDIKLKNDTTNSVDGFDKDNITNDDEMQFQKEASSIIEYSFDDGQTWSNTYTQLAKDGTKDGLHKVKIHQIDKAGNQSADQSFEFTLDTVAQPKLDLSMANTQATSNDENITITLNIADYSADIQAGDIVQFKLDTNNINKYKITQENIDNQNISFDIPRANLGDDGEKKITATIIDKAGNESELSNELTLNLDTTPPQKPVITIKTNEDKYINSSENSINLEISSQDMKAGDKILLKLENENLGSEYTVTSDDITNAKVTIEVLKSALGEDGDKNIKALIVDSVGNKSSLSDNRALVLDTKIPDSLNTTFENDTGEFDDDNYTNNNILNINNLESGAIWQYSTDKGQTWENGANKKIELQNDRIYDENDIQIKQIDKAGNESEITKLTKTIIDNTNPQTAPTITPVVSSRAKPVLKGEATLENGEKLSITINGATYDNIEVVDGKWAFSTSNDVSSGTLEPFQNNETYDATAVVTDLAGNITTTTQINAVKIDADTPTPPTVDTLYTKEQKPTITGTAQLRPNETFKVEVNDVEYTPNDGHLTLNLQTHNWSLDIPNELEANKKYEIKATTTKQNGLSVSDDSQLELNIDTTKPAMPNAILINDTTNGVDGLNLDEDNITKDSSLKEPTNIEDGATVWYKLTKHGDASEINWGKTLPNPSISGKYKIEIKQIDKAGNESDIQQLDIILDNEAPAQANIDVKDGENIYINSQETSVNLEFSLSLQTDIGKMRLGDKIQLKLDGENLGDEYIVTNENFSDNKVTINITKDSLGEDDGEKKITAIITDVAGNIGLLSYPLTIKVNTSKPPTPNAHFKDDTTNGTDGFDSDNITSKTELSFPPNGLKNPTGALTSNNKLYTTLFKMNYENSAGDYKDIWRENYHEPTNDGEYIVQVKYIDEAGNESDEQIIEFTRDTLSPNAPVVTLQNDSTNGIDGFDGDKITNNAILSIQKEDGVKLEYKLDNSEQWKNYDNYANEELEEGSHTIVMRQVDKAGNISPSSEVFTFDIDKTPPLQPTITIKNTEDKFVTSSEDSINFEIDTSGLSIDDKIQLKIKNGDSYTDLGSHIVTSDDKTTSKITINISKDSLGDDGDKQIVAIIIDKAGNESLVSDIVDISLDTTAPNPLSISLHQDTGISHEDNITNDNTVDISGLSAGNSWEYSTNGGETWNNGSGYSFELENDTSYEANKIQARQMDSVGNKSTIVKLVKAIVIDNTNPQELTISHSVANDNPVISGTSKLDDGEKLNVTIKGLSGSDVDDATIAEITYSNVSPDENGNWHIDGNVSGTGRITYINKEKYNIEATIVDKAGNTSIATSEILYDTSKIATPTIDNIITNDSTPTITGTAVIRDGETLEVKVNDKIYTKTNGLSYTYNPTNKNGIWSLEIPQNNQLDNGKYDIQASVKNTATNEIVNDTTTNEVQIDINPPAKPNVTLKNDTTNGKSGYDNDNITNDATINLPTNIENGAKVQYQINNEGWQDEYVAPQIAQGEEKNYDLYVKQIDKAGNSSTQLLSFTLDNKAPDIPNIELVADTGTHGDGITNSARLKNSTNLEDGAKIEYKVDDGNWSTSYDMPSTTGEYIVLVRQIDKAGNVSAEKTININLLTNVSTPNARLIIDSTDGKDGHDSDFITNNSGLIPPNNITDGKIEYKINDGNWNETYTKPSADGDYTVLVRQTDKAGNTSDIQELNFTFDSDAPAYAIVVPLVTKDTTPIITGIATIKENEHLKVTINGATFDDIVVDKNGNWAIDTQNTTPTSGTLGTFQNGQTYQAVAIVVDYAGNQLTQSALNTADIKIDSSKPSTPTVDKLITNSVIPLITGKAVLENNDILRVVVDAKQYEVGDDLTYDSATNIWQLQIPQDKQLSQNTTYSIEASIDNGVSLVEDKSNTELVIDNTTPNSPTIQLAHDTGANTSDNITNNASLSISGKDGATFSYSIDGGNWQDSYTPPTSDGTHNIKVKQTNIAGTTSDESSINFTLKTSIEKPIVKLSNDSTNDKDGFDTDNITNDLSTLRITKDENSTLQYKIDNGNWQDNYTQPSVDGTYKISVRQIDEVGNISDAQTLITTLDTIKPDKPSIYLQNDTTNGNGGFDNDNITNDATLQVKNIEDDAKIEYKITNKDDGTIINDWSTTYNKPTTNGNYTISMRQTDKVGNISDTQELNFTFNNTKPRQLAISLKNITNDENITNDPSLNIANVLENAVLQYKIGNGGQWSETYNPPSIDGAHTIYVRQVDIVGNESFASNITFTIDTQKPSQVILSLSGNTISVDGIIDNNNWEYSTNSGDSWTSGTNTSFVLDNDISTYGDDDIKVRQIDKAGNKSDIAQNILSEILADTDHKDINGTSLADLITGDENDNSLYGFDGNDVIKGGGGNDILDGGSGNDILKGGDGIDTIKGGSGDDTISGDGGLNILTGGDGRDTFVFENSGTNDIITDFVVGTDILDFKNLLSNATNDNLEHYIKVEINNNDTKISIDKDGLQNGSSYTDISITLKDTNITYETLSENNAFVID